MKDGYGRTIDYMRISVTDRCDLRCRYCMPDGCEEVPMDGLLTYEEILRICRVSEGLGIKKIKITGGEPFMRRDSVSLMREIKQLEGIEQVTVTTNGQTMDRYIYDLKRADIDGINISLDSLKPERFRYITGGGDLGRTLNAIKLAAGSGIKTKVNCLLQKRVNEDEIVDIAALTDEYGVDVRFIEVMPVGAGDPDAGVSNEYVLNMLKESWPDLEPDNSVHGNGPAKYYKRPDSKGSVGFISAIHGIFCSECNRVRLTSTGQLKPCLCYDAGTDLKSLMGENDDIISEAIRIAIAGKPEAHCFCSSDFTGNSFKETKFMSQIGG